MATMRYGDLDRTPEQLEEVEQRVGSTTESTCPNCGADASHFSVVTEPAEHMAGLVARTVCLACRHILA